MEQVEVFINEIYSLEIISCPTLDKELTSFFINTKFKAKVVSLLFRNQIANTHYFNSKCWISIHNICLIKKT